MTSNFQVELKNGPFVYFRGDFTKKTSSSVILTNDSKNHVVFRIQTTHPHRYIVVPAKGVINPNSKIEAEFTCVPFHFDENERLNHKFMIQASPQNEFGNFFTENASFDSSTYDWATISNLYQKKLKAVFIPTFEEGVVDNKEIAHGQDIVKKRERLQRKEDLAAMVREIKELKLVNTQLRQNLESIQSRPKGQLEVPKMKETNLQSSIYLKLAASMLVLFFGILIGSLF